VNRLRDDSSKISTKGVDRNEKGKEINDLDINVHAAPVSFN
jgi:hypothetical protein